MTIQSGVRSGVTGVRNGSFKRAVQDAYNLYPARMCLRNDRYTVTAWGENLADGTVKTTAGPQAIFGGLDGGLQVWLNEPLTHGVALDVRS